MSGDGYDRVVQAPVDRVLADRVTGSPGEEDGAGGGGVATPDVDPPQAVFAIDPQLAADQALQGCLEAVHKERKFKDLRLALVDLTDDVMHPRYAGVGDQKQTTIDSMAKLAVFVAACLLRDQVRAAATRLRDEKKEKVLKRIASAWKPIWETRFPDRPADSPKIEKMFSINLGGPEHWQIRFDWDPKGENELHGLAHSSDAASVSYRDRLELMMRWSSNEAATGCIESLGFQALNSLIEDAGFFDVRKGGGLWVSRSYAKDSSWGRRDPAGGGTNQGGTARAVAEVLTLMAQDRLVRAGVAAEMRRFMSRDGQAHGYGSWIVNAIKSANEPGTPSSRTPVKRRVGSWVAKVGLFTKLADCALMERITADDRTLRYIAVVLNCPDEETMNQVSVKLDDCILAMHTPT